jgi:hypothetical protein
VAASTHSESVLAIRRAFEVAGVEFIDENGGGPGVPVAKAAEELMGTNPGAELRAANYKRTHFDQWKHSRVANTANEKQK